MKLLKYFGSLTVAALLLFVIAANFSSVESRFQCSGEISSQGSSQRGTIFMKLLEYRWWVGLWGDSHGSVWVEIPNRALEYIERVVEAGSQLQFYDFQNIPKGHFSTLSKSLAITTPTWSFEGTCKKAERN